MSSFFIELTRKINDSYFNSHTNHHCEYRYGPEKANPSLDFYDKLAKQQVVHQSYVQNIQKFLDTKIIPHIKSYEYVYNLLESKQSKQTMVDVIALNLMSGRKVQILDLDKYLTKDILASIQENYNQDDFVVIDEGSTRKDVKTCLCDLSKVKGIERNIKLYANPFIISLIYLMKQYDYTEDNGFEISVRPGDYVIDAGACFGDTAVDFADKVGPNGKVFSFELDEKNLGAFHKCIEKNPGLSDRIMVDNHALWKESELELNFCVKGAGSHVTTAGAAGEDTVSTISIDDYIERNNIEKVDFIKMDIEGAELPALHGAEKTIRKFLPRLAICVYHNGYSDMINIPLWVKSLNLGYKMYLKHSAPYGEETVLFAEA